MAHYFDNNSQVESRKREISIDLNGEKYSFISDNGVFSKSEVDYGSIALLKVLLTKNISGRVLDIGCGYGTIGLILAKNFQKHMISNLLKKIILLITHIKHHGGYLIV